MKKYIYIKNRPKVKNYRFYKFNLSKKFGLLLIIFGVTIIFSTIITEGKIFSKNSVISPIPINELENEIANNNKLIDEEHPISSYISNSNKNSNINYSGEFTLSFPQLNLNDIKVKANIDGSDPKLYESVLVNSTAHLKGTSLPGQNGNIFIYGHSSVTWFHKLYPYSYQGIFTSLFDLNLGDSININFQDIKYNYIVEDIKVINSDDFSEITNIEGINTLTLMTCDPPGIGDKRLIVKAIQI